MKNIIFVQNGKIVKIINDDILPKSVCERLLFIIKTADEIGVNVKVHEKETSTTNYTSQTKR